MLIYIGSIKVINMEERKFKIGDTISPLPYMVGFDNITIFNIDKKFYHCHITNGYVTIPIYTVENNYELSKKK